MKNKRGRPTKTKQQEIRNVLMQYFQKGYSAFVTANDTGINVKTVNNCFREWEKELYDDREFLEKCKIEKERTISVIDRELISLEKQEEEMEELKNDSKERGNSNLVERAIRTIIKIKDQKSKLIADRINLVNAPTADVILEYSDKEVKKDV